MQPVARSPFPTTRLPEVVQAVNQNDVQDIVDRHAPPLLKLADLLVHCVVYTRRVLVGARQLRQKWLVAVPGEWGHKETPIYPRLSTSRTLSLDFYLTRICLTGRGYPTAQSPRRHLTRRISRPLATQPSKTLDTLQAKCQRDITSTTNH